MRCFDNSARVAPGVYGCVVSLRGVSTILRRCVGGEGKPLLTWEINKYCRGAEVSVADEIDEVEQQLASNVSVRPRLAISHGLGFQSDGGTQDWKRFSEIGNGVYYCSSQLDRGKGTHTLRSFSGVQSWKRDG